MQYLATKRVSNKVSHRKRLLFVVIIPALVCIYVIYALGLKDYSFQTPRIENTVTGSPLAITYPPYGNAGVKLANDTKVFTKLDTQMPTASTIKLLTALLIIQKTGNENIADKSFMVTAEHVAITNEYIAKGGSIVPISVNQTITYQQALSYILVRSANNITDIMVQEVFNTTDAFYTYAKDYLANNNLTQTTLTDPTGFAASTTASAKDLLHIADLALANKIISDITKQKTIVLPDGSVQPSTNLFLATDFGTIIGLKTGYTDEAKSVFISGVQLPNNDIITSVVMGADNALRSQSDALVLAKELAASYGNKTVIAANATVVKVDLPWGESAELYNKDEAVLPVYDFQNVTYTSEPTTITDDTDTSSPVTNLIIATPESTASFPLYIRNYQTPNYLWKLLHPLQ